jgi:hypothetical protein
MFCARKIVSGEIDSNGCATDLKESPVLVISLSGCIESVVLQVAHKSFGSQEG